MMIKKKIILPLLLLVFLCIDSAKAQIVSDRNPLQVAYINSIELLEIVPGKAEATKTLEGLNKKYKDELVLMQNDYNNKYSDFLSNQNTLAGSIKLRRMQELYELEQHINSFMKIAQEDIDSQETYLIEPLKKRLQQVVDEVGIEQGFVCIYDISNAAIAFLTPNAVDANQLVKSKLLSRK